MANPNLVVVTEVYGDNTGGDINVATPGDLVTMLDNTETGTLYKVSSIHIINISAATMLITIGIGTTVIDNYICASLSIPSNETVVISDKTTPLYIKDTQKLFGTTPTTGSTELKFTINYDKLS